MRGPNETMTSDHDHERSLLQAIARRAMTERGLLPNFNSEALAEAERLQPAVLPAGKTQIRDLRKLLWSSIDNDDSRDLDQLAVAERLSGHLAKVFVAIADVDALVPQDSPIDLCARQNTTSVYTAGGVFPMLPERLSTDLTSLGFGVERLAVVVEMEISSDGTIGRSSLYRALVYNHAKLTYGGVSQWLEGGRAPAALSAVPGLDDNIRFQDEIAQRMKKSRHELGALSLQTVKATPSFEGEHLLALLVQEQNRASDIIENFMIGANGATVRFLSAKGMTSIRRVVRTPKRWDRIVEIAKEHKVSLPAEPDAKALETFLVNAKAADPVRFPDLSLAIVKLMGAGEYIAEIPGGDSPGHFGLAVKDYTHSTAPNRRYTDVITQRLIKAAAEGRPSPYTNAELVALAAHCTNQEDVANKVERQVAKSAAALLLSGKVGEQFEALITGTGEKGTWVRLLDVPVEGRLDPGDASLDVGQQLRVRLAAVNVQRGFLDFAMLR